MLEGFRLMLLLKVNNALFSLIQVAKSYSLECENIHAYEPGNLVTFVKPVSNTSTVKCDHEFV